MKLVIEKDRWIRGYQNGQSALLVATTGKMCCLGFLCKAIGLTDDEIRGVGAPWKFQHYIDLFPVPEFTFDAIGINDSIQKDEVIECELTELFATQGIELEFV